MTGGERPAPSLSPGRRRALRAARSKVLQRLFADEYGSFSQDDPVLRKLLRWEGEDPTANAFGDRLYAEILFRKGEIDSRIEELARGWSLGRLTRIDRNILRLGLCEILFDPGMPFRVSVDEALDLAHQFSEPEAVAFINGILHEAAVRYAPEKGPFSPVSSQRPGRAGRTAEGSPASGGEGSS